MKNVKIAPQMSIPNLETGWQDKRPTYSPLTNVASNIRSNNYNFEEEWLLGGDRIITRQYENNFYRERIEFRTTSVTTNYYSIEYYEYDTRPDAPDFDAVRKNKTLVIDLYNKDGDTFPAYGSEPNIVQVYDLYQNKNSSSKDFISRRTVKKNTIYENGQYKTKVTEILSHEQPMPRNVIFEHGRFNPALIPSTFDFANNMRKIAIGAEGSPVPALSAMRGMALGDYFHENLADGKCIMGYCLNSSEITIENNQISHVGRDSRSEYGGAALYIPLAMGTYEEEGLVGKKLYIMESGSANGIPGAGSSTTAGSAYIATCGKFNGSNAYSRLTSFSISGHQGTTESKDVITGSYNPISSSDGYYHPSLLELVLYQGTNHIKKIWFE